jgi:hypothetical protein
VSAGLGWSVCGGKVGGCACVLVAPHPQPPPSALRRLAQQSVDSRHEIHHAGVLAEVVLGLAQERVTLAVGALDDHLLGPLQRAHHVDVVLPQLDPGRVVREGRRSRRHSAGTGRLCGGQVGVDWDDEGQAGQLVQLREARLHRDPLEALVDGLVVADLPQLADERRASPEDLEAGEGGAGG